ncbi:MAG: hypothetical protein Q8941_11600 [Bacteroidota bacterium]|nr:hypothetical protein [Bacteroidota bacterium]
MKKLMTAISAASIVAFLLTPLLSFTTLKDPAPAFSKWEKLGERKVNFKADRDEIGVGRFEGFFDALQVKVKRGPINMFKMVVHFHNGETKEIELRNNFAAGSESRVIDLPGNKRVIDKVVFWYETKGFADSKAIVELWGRH